MGNLSSIEDVKTSNRQVILNHLRGQSLFSRTRLADETGLSKATVTRILNDMLKEGLVEEVRTTESALGRPRILLRLVYRTRCAVGIELTATSARITLTDMNARPLKQRIKPVYFHDIPRLIAELEKEIRAIYEDAPAELMGVGIAVQGQVNVQTGVVNFEFGDGWHDVPLAAMLSEKLNIPVIVVNQAHAAVWGEKWYENSEPLNDLLFVRLGTSAEAGVVLDGRLHTGKLFTAGSIGHMTVYPDGKLCECGNRGCLNTIVSASALLAAARERLKNDTSSLLSALVEGKPSFLTMDYLMQAVHAGDGLALEVFAEVGRAAGIILAGLFNFLNFERVFIGGQLSMAGSALLIPLQEEVSRRALPSALVLGRIEMTRLGADGASIGAATLVLQDPIHASKQF